MMYPRIYNQSMDLLAVLDCADSVGYTLKLNDLSTAGFRLPTPDEKNAYCAAHNYVQLYDGDEKLDLFRVIGVPSSTGALAEGWTEYELEHVIATLVDDVLFGYHEIGGTDISTRQVIEYILDHQSVKRWKLGRCDFSDYYAYKWENANLLAALYSIGNTLTDEYIWTYDTSTTPWTVNLIKQTAATSCEVRYRRNMLEIEPTMDATALVTRLYMLGYGEGVNQLNICEVNNGVPYLDADTISVWGVKASVYADPTIEDARTLKARGEALLQELKQPYMSYRASAIDLHRLTGDDWDRFLPGKKVRVVDEPRSISIRARIVSKSKSDIYGDPAAVELEIANRARDIADSINQLADRQGIAELYSQGATNLYAQQYADNADAEHPAEMRVYIPTGCVRINKVLLSWETGAFRAYEKAARAGGGSVQTSGSGGGGTQTSEASGECSITKAQTIITTAAGTGPPLKGSAGTGLYANSSTSGPMSGEGSVMSATGGSGKLTTSKSSLLDTESSSSALVTGEAGAHTHTVAAHKHTVSSHSHSIESHKHSFSGSHSLAWGHTHSTPSTFKAGNNTGGVNNYEAKRISISGDTGGKSLTTNSQSPSTTSTGLTTDEAGAHRHSMASHTHGMSHTHTLDSHTHNINHYHDFTHSHKVAVVVTIPEIQVDVPSHTHSVSVPGHSHSVSIPDHTHGIEYGIYEGGSAKSVAIRVDGVDVPADKITSDEMDVAGYLSHDDEGKVLRGTWHTIEIVPDRLTRIVASLFVQVFVQSVGGGSY